jgi:hypothetical protein
MVSQMSTLILWSFLSSVLVLPVAAQDYEADCLPYNPNNLRITDEGQSGWLLTDGQSRMLILANEADALDALALAQRHTSHCFIGRNTQRSDRSTYVHELWLGDSGINTMIANEDCIPYNPNNLVIVDEGASGWLLTDGESRMVVLDTENDAQAMLAYALLNDRQCFIGRDNTRSNRSDYIVEYWLNSEATLTSEFTGLWVNEDPNTDGITQVSFRTDGDILAVHMWGACTPQDCDWVESETTLADTQDAVISLTWMPGFAIRHQQLFFLPDGRLVVHDYTYFIDESNRPDLSHTYYFVHS